MGLGGAWWCGCGLMSERGLKWTWWVCFSGFAMIGTTVITSCVLAHTSTGEDRRFWMRSGGRPFQVDPSTRMIGDVLLAVLLAGIAAVLIGSVAYTVYRRR